MYSPFLTFSYTVVCDLHLCAEFSVFHGSGPFHLALANITRTYVFRPSDTLPRPPHSFTYAYGRPHSTLHPPPGVSISFLPALLESVIRALQCTWIAVEAAQKIECAEKNKTQLDAAILLPHWSVNGMAGTRSPGGRGIPKGMETVR